MTKVFCTDLECKFNKLLVCQKEKIRLENAGDRKDPNIWICWDCRMPPKSERKGPDSIPVKTKTPTKRKSKNPIKKKNGT